jgi:hypothetical protein
MIGPRITPGANMSSVQAQIHCVACSPTIDVSTVAFLALLPQRRIWESAFDRTAPTRTTDV